MWGLAYCFIQLGCIYVFLPIMSLRVDWLRYFMLRLPLGVSQERPIEWLTPRVIMISVPNVGQSLSSLSDTDTLTFANTLLIFYLATLSSLCVTVTPRYLHRWQRCGWASFMELWQIRYVRSDCLVFFPVEIIDSTQNIFLKGHRGFAAFPLKTDGININNYWNPYPKVVNRFLIEYLDVKPTCDYEHGRRFFGAISFPEQLANKRKRRLGSYSFPQQTQGVFSWVRFTFWEIL